MLHVLILKPRWWLKRHWRNTNLRPCSLCSHHRSGISSNHSLVILSGFFFNTRTSFASMFIFSVYFHLVADTEETKPKPTFSLTVATRSTENPDPNHSPLFIFAFKKHRQFPRSPNKTNRLAWACKRSFFLVLA